MQAANPSVTLSLWTELPEAFAIDRKNAAIRVGRPGFIAYCAFPLQKRSCWKKVLNAHWKIKWVGRSETQLSPPPFQKLVPYVHLDECSFFASNAVCYCCCFSVDLGWGHLSVPSGLQKFTYQKRQIEFVNHRWVQNCISSRKVRCIFFCICHISVPPSEPIIKTQSGQEVTTFEIGPYEVGQDLALECEVNGGKAYFLWCL